jgi:hypothetical protein
MEYPQLLGTYGLFIDGTMAGSIAMPTSDLYYDLGMMSEAQKWAFEAQTLLPNSPRILKRLVMINLVNRKYDLADKFLTVLDQNMLYHDWVLNHQRFVKDTALTNSDAEISQKRLFNPSTVGVNGDNFEVLKTLYYWNPNNRMAYDYLLTNCILGSHLSEFVKYVPYANRYKLSKLPKSWEEATVIYLATHDSLPANLKSVPVSNETMRQFREFTNILVKNKYNLQTAKSELSQNFTYTYWYWSLYQSPKVTNIMSQQIQVQ